jgi:hypothetical protein
MASAWIAAPHLRLAFSGMEGAAGNAFIDGNQEA